MLAVIPGGNFPSSKLGASGSGKIEIVSEFAIAESKIR
jgi:hypothetical protein